jgi:hypothetical protein
MGAIRAPVVHVSRLSSEHGRDLRARSARFAPIPPGPVQP